LEDADPVLIEQLKIVVTAIAGARAAKQGAATDKERMKAERGW